jgi:hypothetical protein
MPWNCLTQKRATEVSATFCYWVFCSSKWLFETYLSPMECTFWYVGSYQRPIPPLLRLSALFIATVSQCAADFGHFEAVRYLTVCWRCRLAETVTLLTYVREVSDSNLGRDTTNLTEIFLAFPESSRKFRECTFGHDRSLPNPFRFIIKWTLYKIIVQLYLLDVTQCCSLKVNRRFGGTCRLHVQDWIISQARN